MDVLKRAYDGFWHESHWFPPGHNWSSLKNTEFEQFPQFDDLKKPILYAFVFLAVRTVFEWSVARPLGRFLGIENTTSELPNIFYRIVNYVRNFRQEKPVVNGSSSKPTAKKSTAFIPKSTLDKFSECCWRFVFYFSIYFYGVYTLWDKPYFWNTAHCWFGYPLQPLPSDVYWYYMLELSFYWSLIISQFFDVYRKDFWVSFVHHIATVLLLSFSWADNFVRIGSLVLLTHDTADFWMEATKMARYCKWNKLCNTLFVIFTLVWFVTRCIYFPFWIIYSTLIEVVVLVGFYEAYYVFNFLLILLQMLHLFWSYLILKILISTMQSGEMDDARSDSEDNELEDGETKKDD